MKKRFDRKIALQTLIIPSIFYSSLSLYLYYILWPYLFYVKSEVLISLGIFSAWRYGWQLTHYVRAIIYSKLYYPWLKKNINSLPHDLKYPKHIFFIIPSYNEEDWVSREAFHSILSELSNIPSKATVVVATGSDKDDIIISSIYATHPVKEKVDLILQRQSKGKRIAMGHALRCAARRYHMLDEDPNSVTIFMDGDSYLEPGSLTKALPFFALMKNLGALTTNEVAFINTKSSWYKDWFNLKFGQRHILFQSHSLSKKVLTLTGRFSVFRSSIVMQEDLIRQVENDIITHWRHGKFRFLMGDDKSTWFYLLKNKWDMLYLPDVICCSLESRDTDFFKLSVSLPYRWYGNTLRNNDRALAVGWRNIGLFIWICILDQRISMWTSLVGLSGAIILSIFSSFIYLPMYIAWVLLVRIFQMAIISYCGHPVSIRTIPLMLFNQWVGAVIKIHSFYHLSSQKWSKGENTQQKNNDSIGINHPFSKWMPRYLMILFYTIFFFSLLLVHNVIYFPDDFNFPNKAQAFISSSSLLITPEVTPDDNQDDAPTLNKLIAEHDGLNTLIISLPKGILDIKTPLIINKSNIVLKGKGSNSTIFRIDMKGADLSAINIVGEKGNNIGVVERNILKQDSIISASLNKKIKKDDILLLKEKNSDDFFSKIKSNKWRRKYPAIRQELVRANRDSAGDIVYLSRQVGINFDKFDTKISKVNPVKNVTIQDIGIIHNILGHDIQEVKGVYKNSFPEYAVDSIRLQWAYKCKIQNINILNSGSHPLMLENCLECIVDNLYISGSWNKGKKGNGYLKISRTYHSSFTDIRVSDIRHITIHWSSAYNILRDIQTGVDINFHGGGESFNVADRVKFMIPGYHPWPAVVTTKNDAHWAPPSGVGNQVNNILY